MFIVQRHSWEINEVIRKVHLSNDEFSTYIPLKFISLSRPYISLVGGIHQKGFLKLILMVASHRECLV